MTRHAALCAVVAGLAVTACGDTTAPDVRVEAAPATSSSTSDPPSTTATAEPTTTTAPAPPASTTTVPPVEHHVTPSPRPAPSSGDPGLDSTWDRLAGCEAGGNWSINTGNGYSGGLQWAPSTWDRWGNGGAAWQASREDQIAAAERLLAADGGHFYAWPGCRIKLGLP